MEWINELDRELSLLREAEALIYYRADIGQGLNDAGLKRIAEDRRELMGDPSIMARADAASAQVRDPVIRRKAELLRMKAIMMRIEDSPELLEVRHELEQAQQTFKGQMRNAEGMRSFLEASEQAARARIKIGNRLARQTGFESYPHAKLACRELTLPALARTIAHVRNICQRECRELLSKWDAGSLSQAELDGEVTRRLACRDEAFAADQIEDTALRTLSAFDLDIEALPIKVDICDLPYVGAVHPLKIGRDIRVVLNGAKGGFSRYVTVFHELGHALYYAYVPDSTLLLDNRIGREGLAELWAGLVETPEWLREFSSLSESEARELLGRRRVFHSYMTMTFVRESLFELALYEDPSADFADAWNAVTKDCLGIDNRNDIYSEFVFLYPMDIQDYIYAYLIRATVIDDLTRSTGGDLLSGEAFDFIAGNYYREGNIRPWHRRFPGFDSSGAFVGGGGDS